MKGPVLVDTCTLINFAVVTRLELLQAFLQGVGRWAEAVAHETRRQARQWPELNRVLADGWLGEPIEFDDPSDIDEIERIRCVVLGSRRGRPREDLGEAQTIFALCNVPELKSGVLLTDDGPAYDWALRNGLDVLRTTDVFVWTYRKRLVGCPEAHDLLRQMRDGGRRLYVPDDHAAVCPAPPR